MLNCQLPNYKLKLFTVTEKIAYLKLDLIAQN